MMKKALFISMVLLLSACANDDIGPVNEAPSGSVNANSDGVDRRALLTNLVDNVILSTLGSPSSPVQGSLVSEANTLRQSVKNYCTAIDTNTENAALSEVQNQWREVMSLWQQLQLAAVGPLTLTSDQNRIYAWPENQPSACRIYSELVKQRQNDDFSLKGYKASFRGLAALEQVLFYKNLDFACESDSAEKTFWPTLSDTDKKKALCHYAGAASEDVSENITNLAAKWEEGDTKARFIAGGNDSVQAFNDVLFNLETLTKDRKLGTPTGLHNTCNTSKNSCPESVESTLSENSINNIRSNIKGFLAVLTGGEGKALGFDDLLEARLYRSVSDQMITRLKAIDEKLANFSGSLKQNVTDISKESCSNSFMSPESTRTVEACAIFGELKVVTDLLKTDFTTILDVEVPNNASGDGD